MDVVATKLCRYHPFPVFSLHFSQPPLRSFRFDFAVGV